MNIYNIKEWCAIFGISHLEHFAEFAAKCHGTQTRKSNNAPYWTHLVRVSSFTGLANKDCPFIMEKQIAALFHDILEDTNVSEDEIIVFLMQHCSKTQMELIINMVIDLTDVFVKSDYPDLNREARFKNELVRLSKISTNAAAVKQCDIQDNFNSYVVEQQIAKQSGKKVNGFPFIWANEALHKLNILPFDEHNAKMAKYLKNDIERFIKDCMSITINHTFYK